MPRLGWSGDKTLGREGADHYWGVRAVTRDEITRYQAESVKRANMPPVAKHSQTKTNQPQKEAA